MILPITFSFSNRRGPDNEITRRKVRAALRGDLATPYEHFDPDLTATYTMDKTTARMVFSLTAEHGLYLEHIDIESAFLHKPTDETHPIYVKIPSHFMANSNFLNALQNLWPTFMAHGRLVIHTIKAYTKFSRIVDTEP